MPGRRGGSWLDDFNLVTSYAACNTLKANYLLSELGWTLEPIPDVDWDGLTQYYRMLGAGVERRRPYQCRPTFATLALAAGADVYWVSRQLGHADIGTSLKHYARFLPEVHERNLGLLNGYLRTASASEVGEP